MTLTSYISVTDFTPNYAFNSSVVETPVDVNSDHTVQLVTATTKSYTFSAHVQNASMLFLRNLGADAGGNLIYWRLQGTAAAIADFEYYLVLGESCLVPIVPAQTHIWFIRAGGASDSYLEIYLSER